MLVLLRLVEILDDRKDTLVHQTCSHHEYSHVNCLCNDARIGYEVDRRTVEEDIVELASHIFNQVLEVVRKKKLGWVWRKCSYREDEETWLDLVKVRFVVC